MKLSARRQICEWPKMSNYFRLGNKTRTTRYMPLVAQQVQTDFNVFCRCIFLDGGLNSIFFTFSSFLLVVGATLQKRWLLLFKEIHTNSFRDKPMTSCVFITVIWPIYLNKRLCGFYIWRHWWGRLKLHLSQLQVILGGSCGCFLMPDDRWNVSSSSSLKFN